MCAVVVVYYTVGKSAKQLWLFVVMSYKPSVNSIIDPNPMYSHKHVTIVNQLCLPLKINSNRVVRFSGLGLVTKILE
jgi:hypothetical protein